jgi:hypothetical protein
MVRESTFSISGAECVVALCQLGFVVAQREPGRTVLCSRRSLVIVPDRLELPPDVLDAIVVGARVSHDTLLRALEDLPTQPDLPCLGA